MKDNWNFFLEVWKWNIHNVYKTLQTHPADGSPPLMFVFHKSVLSLAQPSFLKGILAEK